MKRPVVSWQFSLTLIVILLLFAGIALLVYNSNAVKSPLTRQSGRVGLVWLALLQFAGDNEDKLPPKLSDLAPTCIQLDGLQFRDPENGKLTDWTYYSGHTMRDPGDTILVASPVPVVEELWGCRPAQFRIVSTIGKSNEVIPESEFQHRISAVSPH